jgi:hypothetical protein
VRLARPRLRRAQRGRADTQPACAPGRRRRWCSCSRPAPARAASLRARETEPGSGRAPRVAGARLVHDGHDGLLVHVLLARVAVEDLPNLYELIALALQTDSTRIATLEIGGDFMPQHLGIKKDWHGLSHHGNDPDAIANLITLERYQIEHLGKFITKLSKLNDGDKTLLDSTTVLFGSGMGNGNTHSNSDLPIILAGGDYKHGDFREVPKTGVNKVRLCNLFVDIAQKMGVEIDSFGNSTSRFA